MKAGKFLAVIALWGLLSFSCNQDPVFHFVASEKALLKPRIEGSPTNMVVFKYKFEETDDFDEDGTEETVSINIPIMFVASGRLHWYAKSLEDIVIEAVEKHFGLTTPLNPDAKPRWDASDLAIPQPGGKVISLAATKDHLYALCQNGNNINASLRRLFFDVDDDDFKWETIELPTPAATKYRVIQNIYADPDSERLFAGASREDDDDRKDDAYAICYLDTTTTPPVLKLLKSGTTLLSGAVYRGNYHYLSTRKGIFTIADAALDPEANLTEFSNSGNPDEENTRMFMGMIKLNDPASTIIAIERGERDGTNRGALFEISGDGTYQQMRYTLPTNNSSILAGGWATGALARWEDPDDNTRKLLTAGIQGHLWSTTSNSHTYGYVEFNLKSDGSFNTELPRNEKMTGVDYNQYLTSLGKLPVNHLFQAPREIDPDMTFFASTHLKGLWSYRDRKENGGPQWNAEE